MAKKKRAKKRKLLYFYFNGELHKALHINRGADIITTWNYPQGKSVKYSYRKILQEGGRAFTTAEVCKLLNRDDQTFGRAWNAGAVKPPQKNYTLDENRRPYAHKWSEDDVMAMHQYLTTLHRGRPRKDGKITPPSDMPNAAEVRAMMRQDTVLYVQDEEGNFIPTWQANKF